MRETTLFLVMTLGTVGWAQQQQKKATTQLPPAKPATPRTEASPPFGYSFVPVVAPGTTIGGHTFTKDTVYKLFSFGPQAAVNDNGEVVFTAQWADKSRPDGVYGGIYTAKRVVVEDGDSADGGITIIHILGNLRINNKGQVSYQAQYKDKTCPLCTGIFIEKTLVPPMPVTVYQDRTFPGRWSLTDDGDLIIPIGRTLFGPKRQAFPLPLPGPKFRGSTYDTLVVGNDVYYQGSDAVYQPDGTRVCSVAKDLPTPYIWPTGGSTPSGPLLLHAVNARVAAGSTYRFTTAPNLIVENEEVHFNAICQPTVVHYNGMGNMGELWTAAGLVMYEKHVNANRNDHIGCKFVFNGIPPVSWLADRSLQMNRSGQILMSINGEQGTGGFVLGTPIKSVNTVSPTPPAVHVTEIQVISRPIDPPAYLSGDSFRLISRGGLHSYLLVKYSDGTYHTYGGYRDDPRTLADDELVYVLIGKKDADVHRPAVCGSSVGRLSTVCQTIRPTAALNLDRIAAYFQTQITGTPEGEYDKFANNCNTWLKRRLEHLGVAFTFPLGAFTSLADMCRQRQALSQQVSQELSAAPEGRELGKWGAYWTASAWLQGSCVGEK